MTHLADLPLTGIGNPAHLALSTDWVALTGCRCTVPSASPDEIFAAPLSSDKLKMVARSAFPHGQTDWVELDGNTLVYTDQSREQSDGASTTVWTLNSLELRTGRHVLLDSSSGKPDSWLPTPRTGEGYVAWVARPPHDDGQGGVITVARVDGSDKHVVLAKHVDPSNLAIADGHVVFDDGPLPTSPSAATDRNVFSVSLDGGDVTEITHDGSAVNPQARGRVLAWSEPAVNDTGELFVSEGGGPRLIFSGINYQDVLGTSVVVFNVDNSFNLEAVPVAGGPPLSLTSTESVPLRVASSGSVFAYGTGNSVVLVNLTVVR